MILEENVLVNQDYLNDQIFLDQLDNLKLKEQYVKITILSWQEEPVGEIQGKVISGSLNLNGSSSLRRTANLTLFAEEKENDLSNIDQDLSINKKVKLEIGFTNSVPNYKYEEFITDIVNGTEVISKVAKEINYQEKYGKIIWFPLGIYVIFDPTIAHSTNGVTISVSLKDKMCLLNGDAGGVIPASTEFHKREYEDDQGIVTIEPVLIRQIIQECVQHWGEEAAARIIIEDVDERIKQVVRWTGDDPLYCAFNTNNTTSTVYYTLNYNDALFFAAGVKNKSQYNKLTAAQRKTAQQNVIIINYGDEAGFIMTDFIYPGELIGDSGATVTSILDKIISVLGNYEYFYDVNGNFHFQEIKNYLNITYTTQALKDNTIQNINYDADFVGGKSVYNFSGSKLISSFNNAPKYSNIKNDFVVWGVRKSPDGSEIPIRYHLAIDNVPDPVNGANYAPHSNIQWYVDDFNIKRAKVALKNTSISGGSSFSAKDYREELYMQGITASTTGSEYSYYFTELLWEWPKIWDFDKHDYKEEYKNNPANFDFFLDILNANSEVGKYSVPNIGRRSMVVTDDKINCIFEQTVPDAVIINNENQELQDEIKKECQKLGQDWCAVTDEIYSLLMIGGIQNSCYQRICELLYQYTSMNETITIQSIPIYYLEPNTRITIQDPASGIFGDFMIQTISLPLSIDGTMSITANKALQKI